MGETRRGETAVIFVSVRTGEDETGYAQAAEAMAALAACQPGYAGIESVRDGAGVGITISFWVDEDAALRWRDNPDHVAIRNSGRAIWYESYQVFVAKIERGYRWTKKGPAQMDQP
jgi:heme-degrading monooxygenase HmoA